MKRYISMFLLLYLCFLLQTTAFAFLKISGISPNLILVLVSVSGFMYGRQMGMFTGLLCGLLSDLLYGEVVGISILIFTVIGYLNGSINKLYLKDDYVLPIAAIAVSDILYGIMFYFCHFLLRGRLNLFFYFRSVMVPEMIYTVLTGIFIFLFVKRIDKWINPETEIPLKAKGD